MNKIYFLSLLLFINTTIYSAVIINETDEDYILQIKQGPIPVDFTWTQNVSTIDGIGIKRLYNEGNTQYSNTLILPGKNNRNGLSNALDIGTTFINSINAPYAIFVWSALGSSLVKDYDNTIGKFYIPSNYLHMIGDQWKIVYSSDPKRKGQLALIFPR